MNLPVRTKLYLIFAIGFVARFAFILTLEDTYYYFDTVHYHKAAQSIIAGEGFGEGYNFSKYFRKEYALPPLYPLFLAGIYFIFGTSFLAVRIIEAIIGALTCVLIYKIAASLFCKRTAFLAGIFSSVFPHLIFLSGLLYVENIFTALVALGVWYCLRWYKDRKIHQAALAGFMLALACLGRPVIFSFYPFFIIWVIIVSRDKLRPAFISLAIFFIVTILTLTPWTIRNYLIFDKITPVSAATEKYLREAEGYLNEGIFSDLPVAGDRLSVTVTSNSIGHHFDFYHNGKYDGRLSDSLKIYGNSQNRFAGIMLKGGLQNDVAEIIFRNSKIHQNAHSQNFKDSFYQQDLFNRDQPGSDWDVSEDFKIISNELKNISEEAAWKNPAVYNKSNNVDSVAIRWGNGADALGVKEGGLAMLLDSAANNANGYLAWRQPTGKLLLYTVKNGLPDREVAMTEGQSAEMIMMKLGETINADAIESNSFLDNLVDLITKDPMAFLIRYTSEFIHFWKPSPDRFNTENEFSSSWSQILSTVFFTPVLLLFFFGLAIVKDRWRETLLLFFMIISMAALYSLFQTKTRYRIPVEPYMIIIASYAFNAIWQKFTVRR